MSNMGKHAKLIEARFYHIPNPGIWNFKWLNMKCIGNPNRMSARAAPNMTLSSVNVMEIVSIPVDTISTKIGNMMKFLKTKH